MGQFKLKEWGRDHFVGVFTKGCISGKAQAMENVYHKGGWGHQNRNFHLLMTLAISRDMLLGGAIVSSRPL